MADLVQVGPEAQRVLAAIRSAGGRPVLVGGCVRDALIGSPSPKDLDVEVYGLSASTDRLAAALSAVWRVDEVGKSFGVIKVRAGDTDLDISLPRRERKTGPGHRGFAAEPNPDLSFAEASARRDFTVNAIMHDPATGEVIDCHGGRADLAAGVLRHTSAAFSEDPLRVLRAVQFAARFGFRLAAETAALCRSLAPAFAELPAERIWTEWEKIGTRGTRITAALSVLEASGWERHFPDLAALHDVPQDWRWHPEGDVWAHSGLAADQGARLADEAGLSGADRFVIVMGALVHDFGKPAHTQVGAQRITSYGHAAGGTVPAASFLGMAGCPAALIRRIVPLVREHMSFAGRPAPSAVRRLVRRLDSVPLTDLVLVAQADRGGRGDPDAGMATLDGYAITDWLEVASRLRVTERPAKGLLTGDHLIAAGWKPGPAFRPVLAAAVAAQDEGQFDDEAGALAWLAARQEAS